MPEFTGFDDFKPDPPEIRENDEKFSIVEFWVDLHLGRPDIQLFDLVRGYLAQRAPMVVISLTLTYHSGCEPGPALLGGRLLIGEPIDVG